MLAPVVLAQAAAAAQPSYLVVAVVAILGGSLSGAVVGALASRRQLRTTGHVAALIELRDAALALRSAVNRWGIDPAPAPEVRLDLVDALGRFDLVRHGAPDAAVRAAAYEWRGTALAYFDHDETVTAAQEMSAWRAFSAAWGDAVRSRY